MHLPPPASLEARSLAQALGVSVTLGDVLLRRGLGDNDQTRKFLSPRLSHLTSPTAMADRDAAAERLAVAVERKQKIVVFGDYDCDGMTAAAIMTDSLRALGGDVKPLLASRFDGGYGLSDVALGRVLAQGPKVLVTCDCGSADHPRVKAATDAGVDVIVIDHHLVPSEPLAAFAFLNPHRPECGFPYKGLASCGLALSVAAAVRARLNKILDLRAYLDLVALGTIADVAPLDGDNRALVRSGLSALASGMRPGIRALAEYARVDLSAGALTSMDISHRLAPRLNAPGRLGSPNAALELLLAPDLTSARSAAAACEQANTLRKELQASILADALSEVQRRALAEQSAMVLARAGWHYGIVGIVAGRLASAFKRPVIVAAIENGIARGSVRSAGGVPVVSALGRCRDLLLELGGHEKAAGVTFSAARLADLEQAFARACEELAPSGSTAEPTAAEVRLDEADEPFAVVRDFSLLEPCGEGNRAPSVCLVDARVIQARGVSGGHLKLLVEIGGKQQITGFGLDLATRVRSLSQGTRVHVCGTLRRDGWRGGQAVEINIEAVESV